MKRGFTALLVAVTMLLGLATHDDARPPLSVAVAGNHLVAGDGTGLQLRGVNRSGTQYACAEGWGVFDGPSDQASIDAMASWGINTVRVSLNETCWLGIDGSPAKYSGAHYRNAIKAFVDRLHARRLYVILDLHWSTTSSTGKATDQQAMPDAAHAPAFWRSVATTFKSDHAVLFDLYNEPHPDDNQDTAAAWRCLRDGGECGGLPYETAGTQTLVNTIRATGAENVIMVGGPQYAGVLDQWVAYKPYDPAEQLAASVHIYSPPTGSPYAGSAMWNPAIGELANTYPVVTGEVGDTDCTHRLLDAYLPWADAHGVSYVAWAWTVSSCRSEPSLIEDYEGTPTPYGVGLKEHLTG